MRVSKVYERSIVSLVAISTFSVSMLGDLQFSDSKAFFTVGDKAHAGAGSFILKALPLLAKGAAAGALGVLLEQRSAQAQTPSSQLRYAGKSCTGSNGLAYFYAPDSRWYANTSDMGVIQVPAPTGGNCNIEWYLDQHGNGFYKFI